LYSRGGRLSADIQAVVAADFIRNLREETKKGFYGRLKQGFFPIPAPIGYLDQGKAKPKIPDPERAPLVIQAFHLYATGEYSLLRLLEELNRRGFKTRRGRTLSLNSLSRLLNNPFYFGLMRVNKTGELFPGKHEPLINKPLFDRVQQILQGKTVNRLTQHQFTFRRMVRCGGCGYSLTGELQKGHIYYRCQTRDCPTKTIREDRLDDMLAGTFDKLLLDDEEIAYAREWMKDSHEHQDVLRLQEIEICTLRLNQIRPRLERLTDAFLDGAIERDLFENRKNTLRLEEAGLKERVDVLESGNGDAISRLEEFLELVNSASLLYKNGLSEEKRDLVKKIASNLKAIEKNVVVELKTPARLLAERAKLTYGSPYRGVPRTWNRILKQLLKHFTTEVAPVI